jgi:TRAP-type uncharacterized transport system fused permease subunit
MLLYYELISSTVQSFGIAIVIGLTLWGIGYMFRNKKDKTDHEAANAISASNIDGFDDLIIELSNNKIMQELSIASSLRTNIGILLAFSGVILSVFFTSGWNKSLAILKDRASDAFNHLENPILFVIMFLIIIFLFCGLTFFITSIVIGIKHLFPRKKHTSIDLLQLNNDFANSNLQQSKFEIKKKVIEEFISIKKENDSARKSVRVTFALLALGVILLASILLFDSSSVIIKSMLPTE